MRWFATHCQAWSPLVNKTYALALLLLFLCIESVSLAAPVASGTSAGGIGVPAVTLTSSLQTLASVNVIAGATGGLFDVSSSVALLSGSGTPQSFLFVDGVAVNLARTTVTNGWDSVSLPAQLTLSPGAHTISLQARDSSGAQAHSPMLNVTAYNEINLVPEPSSLLLATAGFVGLLVAWRRRKRR
jgi:hypothetical protein